MADRDAEKLENLAVAEYLLGHDDESAAAWEAAHRRWAEVGDLAESARCSFWLAFTFMMRGNMAQAQGWLSRTSSTIEADGLDCSASGYLLIPALLGILGEDPGRARELAVQATEVGQRFNDADLRAFGTLAHGQALLALGDTASGMARLDEVMVAVTANEVGPITSGIVYCAVILECMQVFDLPRATEWTDALSAWCDARPTWFRTGANASSTDRNCSRRRARGMTQSTPSRPRAYG